MAIVCNFDCICIDSDCSFSHPIPLQERKIYKKIYDNLTNLNKNEPNSDKRKANCKFGKICNNEHCGYRHRLIFQDRMKLRKSYDDIKINATKTKKERVPIIMKTFSIENKNLFNSLFVDETEEIEKKEKILTWADMCDNDEDFLMTF